MKYNSLQTSNSVSLPKLRKNSQFFITESDAKGFVQGQMSKLIQNIKFKEQIKLKLIQRNINNNIYTSKAKSNRQILKGLKLKNQRSQTINTDDLYNKKYYDSKDLNTITESMDIARQIKISNIIKNKYKQNIISIKWYIDELIIIYN